MPNGIKNWTYTDAKKFLLRHGFTIARKKGSHHQFSGFQNKQLRMVTVPFHNNASILPRTMNSIIAQSGIEKSEWIS